MQQDKFETAAMCVVASPEKCLTPDTTCVSSPIGVRRDSANYYKAKFEKAQEIIEQLQNTTPSLKDIGLLTVKKVTPKEVTKNVRVTQVLGSMEGKDVLSLALKITLDKELKEKSQKDAIQKKADSREAFFGCKEKCICSGPTCEVIKLKECSVCHNVLKSRCAKVSCQGENGEKPTMLLSAAATAGSSSRRKFKLNEEYEESDDESESFLESELEVSDESSSEESETEEGMENDKLSDAIATMTKTQHLLNPPTEEKYLIDKWFAVVYTSKRKITLYIAKFLKRFLVDKDGPVDECLMRCLKPKVDSGMVLTDTYSETPSS